MPEFDKDKVSTSTPESRIDILDVFTNYRDRSGELLLRPQRKRHARWGGEFKIRATAAIVSPISSRSRERDA